MSSSNKYQPYSTQDIFRYLEGTMPPAEMRRLELAALDDPFLQDAIDGYKLEYEKHGKEAMLPYVTEVLAQKTTVTHQKARIVPFYKTGLFKGAVAATIIAGTGLLWLNLSKTPHAPADNVTAEVQQLPLSDTSSKETIAVTRIKEPPPTSQPEQSEKNAALKEGLVSARNKLTPPADTRMYTDEENKDQHTAVANAGIPVNEPVAKTGAIQKMDELDTKFEKSSRYNRFDSGIVAATSKPAVQRPPVLKEAISGRVAGVSVNENIPTDSRSSFAPHLNPTDLPGKMPAPQNHYLAGKTIDKEKFPLDHIVIAVKGDTLKTVSDEMGRFNLKLPDSVATLVASGIGFKTKEFEVNSNKGKVELELTPSETSLSEVVISGYARQKSKTGPGITLDLDTSEAVPAGGWKNFEKYVLENRKIKPGKTKTAVVLSIEIEESGKVGAMEVIESGGQLLDKEAKRLLKDGPKWINKTKQKVAFAKVTIVL